MENSRDAGSGVGVAGIGWGYAQQQAFPGFYELRIYKAQPGKRDALAARFASRTAAIYARHGITNVGYVIPQQSDTELGIDAADTFIYMRGYRRRRSATSGCGKQTDPEFREVVIAQERDPSATLIIKAHNGRYVSLYLPRNRNNAAPGRLNSIWFERVYAKRDGAWQFLSHRTEHGPTVSPAGVDPTAAAAV